MAEPAGRHPFGTTRCAGRSAFGGCKRPYQWITPVSRSETRPELPAVPLSVTMYCATGSRNAAGQWPTIGTVAANGYPLGTRLHVAGVGVVTVEDRSAPGVTQLDVFAGSDAGCETRALTFGRRTLDVRRAA